MILAIDTASKTATAAIVEQNKIIAEFSVMSEKTHSKSILPMVEGMFSCAARCISDVDYIACCAGPGSFTGLRIGAAVAKSIAYSLDKKIIPVSSLNALAYNVAIEGRIICPMIDARGNHVYTAFYKSEAGKLVSLTEYMTVPVEKAVSAAAEYGIPAYFAGSGAENYKSLLPQYAEAAPPHMNMHRAGVLGLYALSERIAPVKGSDFELVYMSRTPESANG